MPIDYSKWSFVQLLKEVKFLHKSFHKLAKEAQHIQIENHELKIRLAAIERHRAVFGG